MSQEIFGEDRKSFGVGLSMKLCLVSTFAFYGNTTGQDVEERNLMWGGVRNSLANNQYPSHCCINVCIKGKKRNVLCHLNSIYLLDFSSASKPSRAM